MISVVSSPINQKSYSLYTRILAIVFIVLFGLTLLFVQQERSNLIHAEIEERTQVFARNLTETLRLSEENLRLASSLIIFFEDINLSQFQSMTSQNFESDQGLLIIEWQPVITSAEREQFVNKARSRGLPDFRLWQPDELGKPILAIAREEHVPVYFMRSRDISNDNLDTLGLDLAFSVERMTSKWQARDTGRARASELFNIITAPDSDYQPLGFAITVPIFERGIVPADLQSKREQLVGYMAGVYSLENIVLQSNEALLEMGFNLDIYDQRDNEYRLTHTSGEPTNYQSVLDFDLYGNKIFINFIATKRFVNQHFQLIWLLLPVAILLFGILSLLILRRLNLNNMQLADAKLELEKLNLQLEDISIHDPLTNLYNRRGFMDKARTELGRLDRINESLSLLMLDLDHFKAINDQWGHPSGDQVLVEFSKICEATSRNVDIIARMGGEEFTILLPHTNREEALNYAERLREAVMNKEFYLDAHQTTVHLTVSIGMSTIKEQVGVDKLLERVDKALYLAKHSGRNCIKEFD